MISNRLAIRRAEADTKDIYSNELHELLLRKNCNKFWKCWNAKFEKRKGTFNKVDGHMDPDLVVASFVRQFKSVCTDTKTEVSLDLQAKYINRRKDYTGSPFGAEHLIDADLVEQVIGNMHRGKAVGFDGLSTEHLLHCHSLVICLTGYS